MYNSKYHYMLVQMRERALIYNIIWQLRTGWFLISSTSQQMVLENLDMNMHKRLSD